MGTKSSKTLRMLTWNARGLMCSDIQQRSRKVQFLLDLAPQADVIHIQEAHATSMLINKHLALLAKSFHIIHSPGPSRGVGGLLSCFRLEHFPVVSNIRPEYVAPGRVLRTCVSGTSSTAIFWNFHNHGLSNADIRSIRPLVNADITHSIQNPQAVISWFSGDFNLHPSSLGRRALGTPTSGYAAPHATTTAAHQHFWQGIFNRLIEFENAEMTHFIPQSMELNKLDRSFVATASSLLTSTTSTAKVTHAPELLHADGISDHAPYLTTISYFGKSFNRNVPIRSYYSQSPSFAKKLAAIEADVSLDSLPIEDPWSLHKK